MIPEFNCLQGCNKCCGPMQFFDEWELNQIGTLSLPIGYECPYKYEKGCKIHKNRPLICRMFGSVEGLECKYVKPETLLTKEQGKLIMKEYFNLEEK